MAGCSPRCLKAHPQLQGVLFGSPETVEGALPFLQSHGVAERVRRVGGDMRKEMSVEADVYLLNGVLQQGDDKNAAAILKACRKPMQAGARLFVIERLMPERAADDPAAAMLDLHMMTIHGGRLRTVLGVRGAVGAGRILARGRKHHRLGRLDCCGRARLKTWMAGTSPAMTKRCAAYSLTFQNRNEEPVGAEAARRHEKGLGRAVGRRRGFRESMPTPTPRSKARG